MQPPGLTPSANPRLLLQRELERRCRDNPRYSLRAFARALEMSPTILSLVLSGKRPLSKKAALKLPNSLHLSSEDCLTLTRWAEHRARGQQAVSSAATLAETNAHQMSLDSFALLSDWHHFAILSLLEVPGSRFEARWIARHLGTSVAEARGAIDRLQRMEIVEKRDGQWRQAVGPIRIGNNVPTAATKRHQRQLLLKALESLDNDPNEVRDFSSMTIAMDPEQIPYARERIRRFRRELAEELEAKGSPKRVYEVTMQVFPVSRPVEAESAINQVRKKKNIK